MMVKPWTTKELDALKADYATIGAKELSQSSLKGRTEKAIKAQASKLGLRRDWETKKGHFNRIYFLDNHFFSAPNILNSYWAGFIAADGCISDTARFSIGLQDSDAPHLMRFLNDVGCTLPDTALKIYSTGYKKKDETIAKKAMISLGGMKQWKEDLAYHWPITPRKSLTLNVPNIADRTLKLSYLAGLIDGDGSVRVSKVNYSEILRISICGGSNEMLLWVKKLVDEIVPPESRAIGLAQIQFPKERVAKIEITGTRASKLAQLVRQLSLPVMTRKWGKAFDYLDKYHVGGIVADRRMTKTEDTVKAIRADLVSGMTRREAEQKYGMTRTEINRVASGDRWAWLNDGLEIPRTYKNAKQLPIEKVLEIKKLLAEGQKPMAIAAMMGLRPPVVRDIKRGRTYNDAQYSPPNV